MGKPGAEGSVTGKSRLTGKLGWITSHYDNTGGGGDLIVDGKRDNSPKNVYLLSYLPFAVIHLLINKRYQNIFL